MPTAAARKTTLDARLTMIQAAISGTLDRNAASYSINGRSISSFSLSDLMRLERETLNELAKVERIIAGGSRFGGIGFKAVAT
jgi:hypothetical protein